MTTPVADLRKLPNMNFEQPSRPFWRADGIGLYVTTFNDLGLAEALPGEALHGTLAQAGPPRIAWQAA